MTDVFKAVEVCPSVYWVGAVDWAVRDFHGYLTSRGTTYNAYLVLAERITLVDTVKAGFFDEMMGRVASVVDPDRIDYVISNHAEPDHSGELLAAIEAIGPKKVCHTMWGSTARMARAVAEGLSAGGAEVKLMSLKSCHRSDIATEMLDAGALVVGTPTLNNQMFPTLADCLTYLKGLKPAPLVGAAFGSFGWSGEGAGQAGEVLTEMGAEMAAEPLRSKYVPDQSLLGQCFELGTAVAESLSRKLADKP